MSGTFVIPKTKQTPADRLGYCVAAQEKLRRLHNEESTKLEPLDMRRWIKGSFQPYSLAICRELLACRAEVEKELAAEAKTLKVDNGQIVFPPTAVRWQDRHALLWAAGRQLSRDDASDASRAIRRALGEHRFAPPADALDEITLPSLDARGPVVDPYEDFTTYTKFDPDGVYTVDQNTIAINGATDNTGARIYSDKGAGHFDDFEHLTEVRFVDTQYTAAPTIVPVWAASNVVIEAIQWEVTSSETLYIGSLAFSSNVLVFVEETELYDFDVFYDATFDTWYYLDILRSGTTLTVDCRTGSHSGTLAFTLAVSVPSGRTYRYIFATNNYHATGDTTTIFVGDIRNLDLQEAAAYDLSADDAVHAHAAGEPLLSRPSRAPYRAIAGHVWRTGAAADGAFSTGACAGDVFQPGTAAGQDTQPQ